MDGMDYFDPTSQNELVDGIVRTWVVGIVTVFGIVKTWAAASIDDCYNANSCYNRHP